jgi:hypothetical protein
VLNRGDDIHVNRMQNVTGPDKTKGINTRFGASSKRDATAKALALHVTQKTSAV